MSFFGNGNKKPNNLDFLIGQPPFMPRMADGDIARLDQLAIERIAKLKEAKLDIFKKLPSEIREEVIARYKTHEVNRAISSINNTYINMSSEEESLRDKFQQVKGYRFHDPSEYDYNNQDEFAGFPPYEDLVREHVEEAADQVLLKEKLP